MKPKKVLLVESDERDCRAVEVMLEALGYEVDAMCDVEAAVEIFPHAGPDVVVTAHPLPTPDGGDFASYVKRLSPLMPVVGIIRRGMREVARDALTHGFDDFLSKPVDPELLASKLRHLIGEQDPDDDLPVIEG